MFEQEPKNIDPNALKRWKLIGPIGIEQGGVRELVYSGILSLKP